MNAYSIKLILSTILVVLTCAALIGCSDEATIQSSNQPRIVGDLSQSATLLEVVLPADCSDASGLNSPLTGQVNNVNLDEVKVVMYSLNGTQYGTIRVFENDGSFSMDLPCDRRVRLLLAKSDWTAVTLYSLGPPAVSDSILAVFWEIDRVIGGVSGLVREGFDNSLVQGVEVSWVINGSTGYDTTGADGFFVVGTTVPSGSHTFLFSKEGYAELTQDGVIPSLEDLVGDNNPYPGDVDHVINLEVRLPPLSAELSGQVRLIDPVSTDTVAAANVEVQLLLNDNIVSNIMKDTTDVDGFYRFENVPAADTLSLVVPSFVLSSYTYGPIDSTLELFPGSTVINAILSASGGGSYRLISQPNIE